MLIGSLYHRWFLRIDPSEETVELPDPDSSYIGWGVGVGFFALLFLLPILGVVIAVNSDYTAFACLCTFFLVPGVFGTVYIWRRKPTPIEIAFDDQFIQTPDESRTDLSEIETIRVQRESRKMGRGGRYWIWNTTLQNEDRANSIRLGPLPLRRAYGLFRRLRDEFGIDIEIAGAVGPLATSVTDGDARSGDDRVDWTYNRWPTNTLMGAVTVGVTCIVGIVLEEPPGGKTSLSAAILVGGSFALGALIGIGIDLVKLRLHHLGDHRLERDGDRIRHHRPWFDTAEWSVEDVDYVVHLDEEPWSGALVVGPDVYHPLYTHPDDSQRLFDELRELHQPESEETVW